MRKYLFAVLVALPVMLAAKPASACRTMANLRFDDIKYASVIVIGRITNYEIVLDQAARQRHKEMLARPDWPPEARKLLSEQQHFLSDYARFDVLVDEVLVGKPQAVLSVTWDNSTFNEPDKMEEGPFLIALREPDAKIPPLRGPSATIMPSLEPQKLTVLQAPCAPPFMFKAATAEAKKVRDMLTGTWK